MPAHPKILGLAYLLRSNFQSYCTPEGVKVQFLGDLEEGGCRTVEGIPPLAHPHFISAADGVHIQCSSYMMRAF